MCRHLSKGLIRGSQMPCTRRWINLWSKRLAPSATAIALACSRSSSRLQASQARVSLCCVTDERHCSIMCWRVDHASACMPLPNTHLPCVRVQQDHVASTAYPHTRCSPEQGPMLQAQTPTRTSIYRSAKQPKMKTCSASVPLPS